MTSVDPRLAEVLGVLHVTFPGSSITRGIEYAAKQRVSDLQSFENDRKIVAHVRGSAGNVYRCTISLKRARDGVYIEGRCSCPVQFDCKHAVAAAIDAFAGRSLAAILQTQDQAKPSVGSRPHVEDWLRRMATTPTERAPDTTPAQELRWIAKAKSGFGGVPTLEAAFVTRDAAGHIGRVRPVIVATLGTSRSVTLGLVDRSIARMLDELTVTYTLPADQIAQVVDDLVRRLTAAGSFCFEDATSAPLVLGEARVGRFIWQRDEGGHQRLTLAVEGEGEDVAILPWLRPWYVDTACAQIGSIDVDMSLEELRLALAAPVLQENEIARVDTVLREQKRVRHIPPPTAFVREEVRSVAPVPHLAVYRDDAEKTVAGLSFAYDDLRVTPGASGTDIRKRSDDALLVYRRDVQSERALLVRLTSTQLGSEIRQAFGEAVFPVPPERLALFLYNDLDALRADGWKIDLHPSVGAELIDASVSWEAQLREQTNRLFHCDLGVMINGERIPLTPVLMKLFRECGEGDLNQFLAEKANDNRLFTMLPDGRCIMLPLQRVQRMATLLVEMLNQKRDGNVTVSLPAALALHEASDTGVEIVDEQLDYLATQLRERTFAQGITVPASICATLRPYQYEGLRWLQFLREAKLGGILADDMGLGKTLQTLAHLMVEKDAGRLEQPVMVVAPTSVVPNWLSETRRFAPELRVLAYHGPQRHVHDAHLDEYDVIITSYPLLLRDAVLTDKQWYMVVLDEAQTIKNAQSKIARATRGLIATHRLALSGTPIENHLGELWSLFEFLMPGAFGDLQAFHRVFRLPIEKNADPLRKQLLIDRVRPFILRRTKEVVAADLPPKTEIVQRIELHPDQLDLYETVRVAMDRKVRTQMKEHGLAQSRIVVLDALLKLRQVCCDARLVKLPSAKAIKHNAKLSALLEMLDEMIEEGRRIIVFSQFTSMLALIEREFARRNIAYVILTGETTDRHTPVAEFQAGKVPVFLISVKAGGTGLNLTAADTVIHYDPWWNPAVERQATDRAHRIGQTKPVFVYKLVIQGSIEERILEMQERKGALARALLNDESAVDLSLSESDVDHLLAPVV